MKFDTRRGNHSGRSRDLLRQEYLGARVASADYGSSDEAEARRGFEADGCIPGSDEMKRQH